MAFPSSSSSSSPPHTSISLQNSNDAAAGCFSGILRRFLCGNLSIGSSNLSKEDGREDTANCRVGVAEEKIKPSPPSIVARLMGLDSMPELGSIPPVRNQDSIGRSRSMNSINNWFEFDPNQRLHRRVRTSLSFRESPTFLREENQDFILLCFGPDGGEKPTMSGSSKELKSEMGFSEELKSEMGFSKEPKSEMGIGELKEKRRESGKSKVKERRKESRTEKKERGSYRRASSRKITPEIKTESRVSRKLSNSIETVVIMPPSPSKREIYTKPSSALPTNHKEIAEIMQLTKKKKGGASDKTVESNCSSENSSPVSVLDSPFDSHNYSETPITSDNSRRKLSLVPSHVSQISISSERELKPKNNVDGERKKKRSNSLYCSDVWKEICVIAGDDMKQLNWVSIGVLKGEDVEEIGIEFVVQIINCLLHETVEELCNLAR